MSYAPVLAAVFVLWPVMGALGAQGYAPLLGLAALAALALARPKGPPAVYAILAGLLALWAGASEFWAPSSATVISGSLAEGDFAVKAASLRIILTTFLGAIAVAGAMRIDNGSAQLSVRVMLGAFAAQGLILALTSFFSGPLLALVYPDEVERLKNGMQNLARNANAFALALPILIAYLATRPDRFWKSMVALLVAVSLMVFSRLDSQSAMIGIVLMFVAMGVIHLLPQHGFRVLFGVLAAYVASAPMLMGTVLRLMEAYGIALPGSFQSRAWAWHVVIGKIAEKPIMGHGIAASKTWRETYADHPDWLARLPDYWAAYQVVPGHPHNMALQIWAETGMIGAVLAGFTLVTVGFRLPRPDALRPDVRYAIAGLAGAATSLFSFAYSVWNEAFWASVILAAVGIILLSKRQRSSL